MSDQRPSEILGALPRRRPHRRSDKRPASPTDDAAAGSATGTTTRARGARPNGRTGRAGPTPAAGQTGRAGQTPAAGQTGRAGQTPPAGQTKHPPAAQPTRERTKAAAVSPPKRAVPPASPTDATRVPRQRLQQPAQPSGVPQPAQPSAGPPTPSERRPVEPTGRHILGTAAQAAAELAEIGLSISARAVRNAVNRLPRP